MAEQLYTIPVNEAFEADCECPICLMYRTLEQKAVDFTMGPSYMEDDVRMETNRTGFCETHIRQMYQNQNRLGLALMMLSHVDRTMAEMEKFKESRASGGLFRKNADESRMKAYCDKKLGSCYICERIDGTFGRYIATLFHLYQHDDDFVKKFEASKGFCMKHYSLLFDEAQRALSGAKAEEFLKTLNRLYFDNMKRVRDELKWFVDKFDYRNIEEPWGNSRDALIRTIQKTDSVTVE